MNEIKWIWRNDNKSLDVYRNLIPHGSQAMMDSAQRALLEISYEAFHGSGFPARLLDGQLRGTICCTKCLGLWLCCSWLIMVYLQSVNGCKCDANSGMFTLLSSIYTYIFHPWDISVVLEIIQDPTFPNWSLKHWRAAFECCGKRPCDNVMLTWRSWTSRKKCGSDTLWRRMDVDGYVSFVVFCCLIRLVIRKFDGCHVVSGCRNSEVRWIIGL